MLTRAMRALVVALAGAVTVAATTQDDVCGLPMSKMYVRDARQMQFPAGFLSCVGASQETIARCEQCACRQPQQAKSGGKVVSWGLCVEGMDDEACASPQAPDRKLCTTPAAVVATADTAGPVAIGADFRPGKVQAASGDTNASVITTKGPTEQEAMDANTGLATSGEGGKNNTGALLVVACAVAAVAGIAVFAIVKKRNDKTAAINGGAYKDSDTSKARASAVKDPAFRDSATGYGSTKPGAFAGQRQSQRQSHQGPLPPFGSRSERHSSSTSDEDDLYDDDKGGFSSFADTSRRFSDINLDTNASLAYSLRQGPDDDDDYYYAKDEARVSIGSDDDDPPVVEEIDLRDSTDSMLFSSSSALTYFEDEGSPRRSIEF